MKIDHLKHRHGGKIVEVNAICHRTWKGVADWCFEGSVTWSDDGKTSQAEIGPWALCCDESSDTAREELDRVLRAMRDHLNTHGEWHDIKHKRDGRCYSWTPKIKEGRTPL